MKINVFLNFLYCLSIVIEHTPVDDDVVTIDVVKDSASDPRTLSKSVQGPNISQSLLESVSEAGQSLFMAEIR